MSELQALSLLEEELNASLLGKPDVVRRFLVGLISGGSLLLEDVPGVGKTMLVRKFSSLIDADYSRVQGSPDLLPTDVVGLDIYHPDKKEFLFLEGPVFSHVLLFDEINRAPSKTQSVLLEAMAEFQVSVFGSTRELPSPFWVIATANPYDTTGTFRLPQAQLDRFFMRLHIGLPSRESEIALLDIPEKRQSLDAPKKVMSLEDFLGLASKLEKIQVSDAVKAYIVDVVRATRTTGVGLGASPRSAQSLFRACQALALVEGRDFVAPDDVKFLAPSILNHRLGAFLSVEEGCAKVREVLEELKPPLLGV